MSKNNILSIIGSGLVLTTVLSQASLATEGYFQTAFGARHSSMAGAGLAHITDSTGLGLNPAGIVGIDSHANLGIKLFVPKRKTTGSGQPGFTPLGEVKSGNNIFAIPNFSYIRPLNDKSAIGIGLFANGGMNTSYPDVERDVMECGGGSGVFCSGKAGVNLHQVFITVGYAYQLTDNLKVGISPILAIQNFKAKGVAALSANSSDPENFSDRGSDRSVGLGYKLGTTYTIEDFSLAATYQGRIDTGHFDKYTGLFAEGGGFDVPSSYAVGLAYALTDNIHVAADYRHVNYNSIESVGNASTIQSSFGLDGGPGFGWSDVDSYKFGLEIVHSDTLTYRLGVGFNTNPVSGRDVTLNVLAPGVVTRHYSAGFTYNLGGGSSILTSATYVPYNSVTGAGFANPNHTVEIGMKQSHLIIEWQKRF